MAEPRPSIGMFASALALSFWLLGAAGARAQLGAEGSPIETSDYAIDLYTGVVQGSAQMTGLGGAFVGIAEGVDGSLVNPVAPVVRPGFSVDSFDYWLGLGVTVPFSVGDFFNTGGTARGLGYEQGGYVYAVPAMNVQFGRFGVGASIEFQRFQVSGAGAADDPERVTLRLVFMSTRVQAAYQFLEGQLLLGVGGVMLYERAAEGPLTDGKEILGGLGFGAEAGVMYRPNDRPYRLALSFESPIATSTDFTGDDIVVEGFYVPRSIYKPWELVAGFVYQFGERPLNAVWRTVEETVQDEVGDLWAEMSADERALYTLETKRRMRREFRTWSRNYLLISTALHLIGPSRGAVSVDSFLGQTVQRSGGSYSVSPRLGLETEIVPNIVRLRYGNYLEPSRVAQTNDRFHYTVGLDIRLGWWNVFGVWPEDYLWKLAIATDIARDYRVFTFSIGGWY